MHRQYLPLLCCFWWRNYILVLDDYHQHRRESRYLEQTLEEEVARTRSFEVCIADLEDLKVV